MNIFNRDSLRKKQGIPIAMKRIFGCTDTSKGGIQKVLKGRKDTLVF